MKLFGGGGSRNTNEPVKETKALAKKTPKQRKRKWPVIVLVVLLAIVTATAAAIKVFVKPPSLAPENDNTILNDKSGDAISAGDAVDLNGGTRISDYFTFVICATDEDGTRTDNILVAGFDTKNHKVNVINVPRDIMSNVSRKGANRKINAAYGTKKGIEQTKTELKKVLGFTPDKYIVVNFQGIADIVDAIGGVDYNIEFYMKYKDPTQNLDIDFDPGPIHMNGEQVVEYLRWRHNGPGYRQYEPAEYDGGDEGRIKKQQEFLKYLASQVLTIKNATKIPALSKAVFNNVKTDITAGEMLWLGYQAVQVKTENIQMFTLPGYGAMSTAGSDAAYSFFFVNEREALKLINQYFNPYDKEISDLDLVSGPTKPTSTSKPRDDDDEDDEDRKTPSRGNSSDDDSNKNTDNEDDSTGGSSGNKPSGSGSGGENTKPSGSGGTDNSGGSKPDDGGSQLDPGGTGGSDNGSGGSSNGSGNEPGGTGGSSGESGGSTEEPSGGSGSTTTPTTDPES